MGLQRFLIPAQYFVYCTYNSSKKSKNMSNNIPNDTKGNHDVPDKNNLMARFGNFLKQHPTQSVIFAGIVVVLSFWVFFSAKNNNLAKRYETKIILQKDSLNTHHMMNNARIFSWAVRSELTRGNMEQVKQFFDNYLETGMIIRVMLVNPEDGTVLISTNKKDEGTKIDDSKIITASSVIHIDKLNSYYIVNLIMGLDKKIGIVVVEIEK